MNETNDLMPHSGGNVLTESIPEPKEEQTYPEPKEEQAYERAEEPVGLEISNIDLDLGTISNDNVRGVSINPLSSGYMVKVGCQSVAVESTERLIDMLSKYLTDPAEFERKWYSKNVRNRLENII